MWYVTGIVNTFYIMGTLIIMILSGLGYLWCNDKDLSDCKFMTHIKNVFGEDVCDFILEMIDFYMTIPIMIICLVGMILWPLFWLTITIFILLRCIRHVIRKNKNN